MDVILVVDDAPEFQLLVKTILGDQFEIEQAVTAMEARQQFSSKHYDLILLDATLPDGDGFELIRELKAMKQNESTPVFFMTARSAVDDRVAGFALGADDYIVKPFEPKEFKARIAARCRMSKAADRPGLTQDAILNIGPIKMVMGLQKAFAIKQGEVRDLALTPIEFKLLYCLSKNEGNTLTRDDLLRSVWGDGLHVVDRVIDKHICSLRQKMTEYKNCIQTVPRAGYRFKAPL